jgi:dynein heavy chain, axonemal
MAVGDIKGSVLESFRALVTDLFVPILQEQSNWGKAPEENTKEFLSTASKFSSVLNEAQNCLKGGIELTMPSEEYVSQCDLRPGALAAAASNSDVLRNMEDCLTDWCREVELLLGDVNSIKDGTRPAVVRLQCWVDLWMHAEHMCHTDSIP